MKTQRRTVCLLLFINLFWFLIIALLSQLAPVHSDDVILTQIYGTEQRIQSVRDFFYSIRTHQQLWGGTPFSWGICQFMALSPRIVFSVCNALVWMGTVNLFCRYACVSMMPEKTESPLLLCMVYLALWFFFPQLSTAFWLNGSICYLWFNAYAFLFGYLFFRERSLFGRRDLSPSRTLFLAVVLFLFGFTVGSGLEASTDCTLLAALGLGFLWVLWQRKPLNLPLFAAAFLGDLIGACISILSPGNFERVDWIAETSPYTASFLFRIIRTSYHGFRYTLVLLGITAFFTVLNRKRYLWKQMDELFFVLLAAVNVAVMAIPNGYSTRTVILSAMLMIIACARSAVRLFCSSPTLREHAAVLRKALWVFAAFLTAFALLEIATGLLLHFTQGTTFDRQTIYFAQYFELF